MPDRQSYPLALLLALLLGGCSSPPATTDSGVPDSGAPDAGAVDAGEDAGVDAGFDAGFCGAANFTAPCPNGSTCPGNSVCNVANRCVCSAQTTAVTCGGQACDVVSCAFPNWWCAPDEPGSCGPTGFTVACSRPTGTFFCPTNTDCNATNCQCPEPFLAVDCTGAPCNGTCAYPNWRCAPRDAGTCGVLNFTVQCPTADGGYYWCPNEAFCLPNRGCGCPLVAPAVDCSGNSCSGGGNCTYPNWWCHG